ncbi:MGMT family protein [Halovenus rubra]|uniref:MGMT family protein n=2 Tax=Halovenus rubra TaxID=869890 RepID=A0ACC7E372_9EURY|nr:MGMT family protein [Halovenus rubra]
MDETAGIYALQSSFLDRFVQVGMAQGRVISVDFPSTPPDETNQNHELLDRIEEYLQGETDDFDDVEVAMTMPTDHRKVLDAVTKIPYGENATVKQVRHMAVGLEGDDEEQTRTIREGLAANQVPIFIPTHRVRDGPGGMPPDIESKLRAVEGL